MSRAVAVVVALTLLMTVSTSHAAGRGASRFALEIGQGRGDFVNPTRDTPGYVTLDTGDDPTQLHAAVEYWYQFAEDWAATVAGGAGYFVERSKPDPGVAPGELETKYSSRSFFLRMGVDRLGRISEGLTLFLGPGVEYWSGRTKFEDVYGAAPPDDEVESPTVTRVGLSGRVGAILRLSDAVGLVGQVGHRVGHASAEKEGAKASWWPSSFSAAWGLVYTVGGAR
jgi:hypothetical protein